MYREFQSWFSLTGKYLQGFKDTHTLPLFRKFLGTLATVFAV